MRLGTKFHKKVRQEIKNRHRRYTITKMSGASESQNVMTFKKLAHAQGALLELF